MAPGSIVDFEIAQIINTNNNPPLPMTPLRTDSSCPNNKPEGPQPTPMHTGGEVVGDLERRPLDPLQRVAGVAGDLERRRAGQELEQDDPEGPDVRGAVAWTPPRPGAGYRLPRCV